MRLQSVGPDREGSSKLENVVSCGGEGGDGDMASTPEPSTILGLSLLGGVFAGLPENWVESLPLPGGLCVIVETAERYSTALKTYSYLTVAFAP